VFGQHGSIWGGRLGVRAYLRSVLRLNVRWSSALARSVHAAAASRCRSRTRRRTLACASVEASRAFARYSAALISLLSMAKRLGRGQHPGR
jgi:hypothetical protein